MVRVNGLNVAIFGLLLSLFFGLGVFYVYPELFPDFFVPSSVFDCMSSSVILTTGR